MREVGADKTVARGGEKLAISNLLLEGLMFRYKDQRLTVAMPPDISCEPVRVFTDSQARDDYLIFTRHALVAVVTLLSDEEAGDDDSRWFLEAGIGPCGIQKTSVPKPFRSLEEAKDWVRDRVQNG